MTTIAVIKASNSISITADGQVSTESAIVGGEIVKVGGSDTAVWAAAGTTLLCDLFLSHMGDACNVGDWDKRNVLDYILSINRYCHDNQLGQFEANTIIANQHGVFTTYGVSGVSRSRILERRGHSIEIAAIGSGAEYAIGALEAMVVAKPQFDLWRVNLRDRKDLELMTQTAVSIAHRHDLSTGRAYSSLNITLPEAS